MIKPTLRIVIRAVIVLIVLIGAVNALGYLLTPLLAQDPGRVADYLSEATGRKLEIDSLRAHWSGRGPVLELQGVRTPTGGGDSLELDSAEIDLHLPGLLSGDPWRVTLAGLRLQLERTAEGRIRLAGAGPLQSGPDDTSLTFDALPAHLRLRAAEVHWRDRRTGAPALVFAPVELMLHHTGGRTRLTARVDTAGGSLRAAAELQDLLTAGGADGRVAFRVEDLDLARLASGYVPTQYALESMRVDGSGRLRVRNGVPVAAEGRIRMRDLRLAGTGSASADPPSAEAVDAPGPTPRAAPEGDWSGAPARLEIELLETRYQWRQETQWRRLRLHQLTLIRNGRRWPISELVLAWRGDHRALAELRAAADFLRIEDLLAILQVRAPWPGLERLGALAPRGDLTQLQLRLTRQDGELDWRAAARFRGLGVDPAPDSPGIDGLGGRLIAAPARARVELDAFGTTLQAPRLFPRPLPIRRLHGRLDWRLAEDGGWQLQSDRLRIDLPDVRTRSRLRLDSRGPGARDLFIDLQTGFSADELSNVRHYYPTEVMRSSLVRWLHRGLVSGRVPAGTLLLHGPLADFPFDKTRTGHFEVLFGAEDLIIDYQREWPRLEEITAELRFHNNRLDADIQTARIYASTVEETRVSLPSLDPALPVQIRGRVHGPLADELRLLRESPLRRRLGEIAGALGADGPATLDLDADIPIDEHGDYRVDGTLRFDDATLTVVEQDLRLEQLSGALRFDLDSVRAERINGRALGSPVSIAVRRDRPRLTDIVALGRFEVAALRRQLPWLDARLAAGASDYEILLGLPDDRAAVPVLEVRSDLVGTELRLPEPLAKPAQRSQVLAVKVPLADQGGVIHAALGGAVEAALSGDLRRIGVRLGGGPAALPGVDGLRVRGKIAELPLDGWLEWLSGPGKAPGRGAAAPAPELPLDLALTVGRIELEGFQVPDADLRLQQDADLWSGEIDSPRLSGRFRVPLSPHAGDPIRLDLDRLQVDYVPAADTPVAVEHGRFDPVGLPPFELVCRQLIVNGRDMGILRVTAAGLPRGLRFDQVRLDGGPVRLDAAGEWVREPESPVSRLQGEAATGDLGDLLTGLGFERQLEDAAARAQFVFQWPGDPAQFGLSRVVGNLELDIERGRFIDIDPGVTRMIGLLNFNALQRRLRLDFSDLFAEGFAFDSITGGFELNYGVAVTDDLTLKGPAGRIEVRGRTGLKARDFDQRVSVTPRFDATLPVASAIAGGPVAGVVVLLAQQLMREEVDKINRFQYRVSGGWHDPKIELLDSGGTLSKLFGSITGRGRAEDDSGDPAEPRERDEEPVGGFHDGPQ